MRIDSEGRGRMVSSEDSWGHGGRTSNEDDWWRGSLLSSGDELDEKVEKHSISMLPERCYSALYVQFMHT